MAAIEGKELEGILDKAMEVADRIERRMRPRELKDVINDVLPELVSLSLGLPIYVPDFLRDEVGAGLLGREPQVFKGAAGELKLWPAGMDKVVPDIERAAGILDRLAGRLVPITDALQYVASKIPWIRDVRVSKVPAEEIAHARGMWMPGSRVINVADDLTPNSLKEVLAHELQHAVMSKGPVKSLMGWNTQVDPELAREFVMSPGGFEVLDRLERDVLDHVLSRAVDPQQAAEMFESKIRKTLYDMNMGELLANRTGRRVRDYMRTGVDTADLEMSHLKDYAWW